MQPTTSSQRGFVTYCYVSFVVIGVVTTMLGPLLPLVSRQWQLSVRSAGTLFSFQFAGAIVGTLLSATQSKRIGAKAFSIVGLLLCAAGTIALTILPWPAVCGAIAVYGLGLGTSIPAINLAVARTEPQEVGRVAILNACWTLGALAGPLTLQAVEVTKYYLDGVGIACGVLALCGILVQIQNVDGPAEATAELKAQPRFWIAAIFAALFFICVGAENVISGWITFYSVPIFHDAYRAMTSAAVFWAAFLFGRLMSTRWVRKTNHDAALTTSAALAICAIFLLIFAPGIKALLLAIALAGFGFSTIYPILITRMSGTFDARSPFATVCFAFSGLGAATLPYLSGRISSATGNMRNGLALSAVLLILLISLYTGLQVSETTSRTSG